MDIDKKNTPREADVEEPPSKKSKTDATITHNDTGTTITSKDEEMTENARTEEVFDRPVGEKDVGITEYISKHEGFHAVIKQRYSDFIVNEIDINGEIVHLTSLDLPPVEKTNIGCEVISEDDQEKLRELVESKDHSASVMIEVDDNKEARTKIHLAIRNHFSTLESSTVDVEKGTKKSIKVVYPKSKASRDSRWAANRPKYCKFVLYKENKDTMDTISLISKNMRLNTNLFQYAGTKDKRAKTSQEITAFKVEAERIKSLNDIMRNMSFGNFRYVSAPLKLGQLQGNHFSIVLRNVEGSDEQIEEGVSSLKSNGFINYFGMQRFGTTTISTHTVGKAILRGDYELAVDLLLRPRSGDDENMTACRKIWSETKDAKQMLNRLPPYKSIEQNVLYTLAKQGSNMYLTALQSIPRNSRLLYVHSYQSYVWNSMVSKRIQMYGLNVVEGDLVLKAEVDSDVDADSGEKIKVQPVIVDKDNIGEYHITDVVLPLPGYGMIYPSHQVGELYKEMLSQDSLDINNMKNKHKDFSLSGSYRKILVKPTDVSKEILRYDDHTVTLALSDFDRLNGEAEPKSIEGGKFKALRLEFSLPTSSYATMALREILKTDTSSAHQSTLNVT